MWPSYEMLLKPIWVLFPTFDVYFEIDYIFDKYQQFVKLLKLFCGTTFTPNDSLNHQAVNFFVFTYKREKDLKKVKLWHLYRPIIRLKMSKQVHSMVHTRHIPHRFLPVISVNVKFPSIWEYSFSRLMINITLVMMGVLFI